MLNGKNIFTHVFFYPKAPFCQGMAKLKKLVSFRYALPFTDVAMLVNASMPVAKCLSSTSVGEFSHLHVK